METLLPIRRRASQHPRRANRSPRGTRPSCKLTARPCAARQKAATIPLTNHKKNHQPRFIRNQQYSITALTDGGGSIVERYAYTAYGQVTILDTSLSQLATSAVGNRYTFTGREWDEGLSLYHYRARMYDAVAGRFLTRDPIGYEGSEWSLYEYARSAPTVYVDPEGNRIDHIRAEIYRRCLERKEEFRRRIEATLDNNLRVCLENYRNCVWGRENFPDDDENCYDCELTFATCTLREIANFALFSFLLEGAYLNCIHEGLIEAGLPGLPTLP